jgi:apolipoprotein N-acyltransferase
VAIGATAAVASVAPDGGAPRAHLSVAAVQGGGRRGLNSLEVPSASVLAAELAATGQIEQRTGLVLWPEDAVALGGPLRGSPVESLLSATARRLGTTLLVGVTEPAGPGRFRNEAVVFAPSGREVASYEKVHPVPFGEYVPLRSLFSHFVGLSAVPRDAVVGHGSGMVSTPAGRLAVLLSYETFFTERGRSGVRAGGELVIVPTNTASYSTAQVPDQELAASRLQAVGTGRDLVQVAATGFSAVVDNHGRLLRVSRLGVRAVVRAKVALRTGETPYDQLGELPALLAAIALLAGGWFLAGTGLSWRWRWPSPRWASSRRAAC